MNNLPELHLSQHCKCRTFLGNGWLLNMGYDRFDSYGDIFDPMWHIYNNCTKHVYTGCPPFSTHVFYVRTQGPYQFAHDDGSTFDVVCKEIVEYCVDNDTFDGLVANLVEPEALKVPAKVLIVGEYANTHLAARNSIQSIVARLEPPGPINKTLAASDFPEFEDRCSGCNLLRVSEEHSQDGWSFRRYPFFSQKPYKGISQEGWSGVYNCKFCPSGYSTVDNWLYHQRRVHQDAIQRTDFQYMFRCPDCHRSYLLGRLLERHWRKQHEEHLIHEGNVSFCNVCETEHHDVHGLATHRSGPAHKKALAAGQQQNV